MNEERIDELMRLWGNETGDPATEEWREELTSEEWALVERWDNNYAAAFAKLVAENAAAQEHFE